MTQDNLVGNCTFRHLKTKHQKWVEEHFAEIFSALSALLGVTELSLAAVSGSHSTGQGRTLLCLGSGSTSALVGIFCCENYRRQSLRECVR